MAGNAEVADSVDGGTVNATEVSINSNQVIDGSGNWVGQPITVDWNNIDPNTIPSYIADGDDNTQLSETQVEGYITNGVIDLASGSQVGGANIVTTATDSDTLAGLSCSTGEIAGWNGSAWTCTSDNGLTEQQVETYVTNGAIDLAATSSVGGYDFITSNDETLTGLSCLDGGTRWDQVAGLWICSSDTVGSLNCQDGEVTIYSASSGTWVCSDLQSLFDNDGDGIATWADCDDNDPTSFSNVGDADCDGVATADDCDDNDPNSNTVSNDGDCDGVLTSADCDDADATLLDQSNDNDCDGVLTNDDCDDNDPNSTTTSTDADCDGYESSVDCNDSDASINPGATEVNGDNVDNDCDGTVDNAMQYTQCGNYYVSVDTYQGDFNAGGGFCTQMVGQTAYLVRFPVTLSCIYRYGIWQGNSTSSNLGSNCSLYSSISGCGQGYGNQGGYGSCAQYRHVVCSVPIRMIVYQFWILQPLGLM